MSKIWTIIKKELKRFFSDKRMLVNLIMPGIIIFVVYALMGTFMKDAFTPDQDFTYNVVVNNMVDEYKPLFESNDAFKIELIEDQNVNEVKDKLKNKEIELYVEFDKDFTNKSEPYVDVYYNSSSNESSNIYSYITTILGANSVEEIKYNFHLNSDLNKEYNLATKEDMSAKIMQMLLPYLLVIMLFTGCMTIATESIAGSKERGTLNTVLVTPTKRSHIAIGKIIALSIVSLVSATSSFIGLICSLPLLMQTAGELTISMYGFGTYLCLYLIILATVILFTTLLSIVSAIAKNVKEANQYGGVLMVVVMVLGITSLVGSGNIPTNHLLYLIPIYNSVQAMASLFAMNVNIMNFIVTILSNIVYIAIGVIILAKMFDSEKMMSSN